MSLHPHDYRFVDDEEEDMADLAELRILAEKAKPGPGAPETWREDYDRVSWYRASPASQDDARFIGACDPDTVLALLDRIRDLEQEVADLNAERIALRIAYDIATGEAT